MITIHEPKLKQSPGRAAFQGWQVLPMPGFNHGLNPGLNRVGQNSKNPVTVGKTGQNWVKRD